jgi:hypothetical protein
MPHAVAVEADRDVLSGWQAVEDDVKALVHEDGTGRDLEARCLPAQRRRGDQR